MSLLKGFFIYWEAIGKNRFRFRSYIRFSFNYMFVNHTPTNEYEEMQLMLARRTLRKMIEGILLVIASFALVIIGPIFVLVTKQQYSIPTGVVIPFVDPNTLNGFIINCAIQSVASIAGGLGLIGVESYVSIGDSTVYAMKELTKYHFKRFNENISKSNFDHEAELRYIFKMLEDIKYYVDDYNSTFYYKSFFQPTFSTITVPISIFCQYVVIERKSMGEWWTL